MVQQADVQLNHRDHVGKAFICVRLLPLLNVTALTIMPLAGS
jgi:hypothetical protein